MPGQEQGLQFTNSSHVDPYRQQCSLVTIQSDPRGHFAALFDHLRKITGNYTNVLLQISQMDPQNALAMIKFASGVEGMAIFLPKPVFKGKNASEAKEAKEKGNGFFKKGDVKNAFLQYSVAVIKAVYPDEKEIKVKMIYNGLLT